MFDSLFKDDGYGEGQEYLQEDLADWNVQSNDPESYGGVKDMRKDKLLAYLFGQGYWFQFPKFYNLLMSPDEAILMAYLANFAYLKKAVEKHHGWFYCHRTYLINELFWTLAKQERVFASLEARGYLETMRRRSKKGGSIKKWLRIKYTNILDKLEKIDAKFESLEGDDKIPAERMKKAMRKVKIVNKIRMLKKRASKNPRPDQAERMKKYWEKRRSERG